MSIAERYNIDPDEIKIGGQIKKIKRHADMIKDKNLLQHIFNLIDLTTLNTSDTDERVKVITEKVNGIRTRFPNLGNVAAICVYPVFVPVVKKYLRDENVRIVSTAAGFPSSQTFLDVKLKEVEKVLEEGADEIDIVISLGKYLSGEYDNVSREIRKIRELCGHRTLKVILETGEMPDLKAVKHSSFLAMEAGADFIKTSTGKSSIGSTPEALYVMCEAIKEYHKNTGKQVGIKPAGGVTDSSTAVFYYLIISEILGNEWLNSKKLRFGASKLANTLLGEKYFG